jgi:hypothetical protein
VTLAAAWVIARLALRAALAGGLLLAAALIGHALLPRRLRPRKAIESVPLGLSAGLLATGWLAWVAGTLLGTWAIAPVWVVLVAAAARRIRPFLRDLRRAATRVWLLLRASPLLAAALGVTLALLLPALALPLVDSDGIRYQVALPKLALLTGRVESYHWIAHSFFPQIGSLFYLVADALGGGETCKLAHAEIAVAAAAVLAFLLHRGRRSRRAALIAPLLVLAAPVAAGPATAAFLDHFAVFHLAVATLLLVGSGTPAAVGLSLGAAFATRLTAAPAVLGLGLAAWLWPPHGRRAAAFASLLAAGAMAYLPFGVHNAALTGDPFFPLGLGVLGRPLAGITAAGLGWTVEYRAAPRGLLAFGWFQGQPGMSWDDVVGIWVLLALFAIPVVIGERRLRPLLGAVLPSLAVALVWHPPGRYFLPLFWMLAAILAVALARLLPRLQTAAAIALAASAIGPAAPHLLLGFDALPYLLGRVSREAVLERHVPGYRAARFVATLPRGTVMALDFPAPYYFDRPWIVEGVLNEPPLATWLQEGAGADAVLARLRSLGVRELLVTPGYGAGGPWSLVSLAHGGAQAEVLLAVRARLRLVATIDGVDVYEVPG